MSKKHNKKRNDTHKKSVKEQLFQHYGEICMICERKLSRKHLTLHHIKKWQDTHCTNFADSSLVCTWCHNSINIAERTNTKEYIRLNQQIRNYKATH